MRPLRCRAMLVRCDPGLAAQKSRMLNAIWRTSTPRTIYLGVPGQDENGKLQQEKRWKCILFEGSSGPGNYATVLLFHRGKITLTESPGQEFTHSGEKHLLFSLSGDHLVMLSIWQTPTAACPVIPVEQEGEDPKILHRKQIYLSRVVHT